MKSIVMKTIFVLFTALLFGASPSMAAPLRILAATNDLAAIARAVAGPSAEIKVVARPDRDLHSLEVRPSMMTMAAKADVYLAVGLSLDLWSEGIVQGSRNTKLHVVTCSDAVQPLEVPAGKVDASMGDVHPYGNPHYWLDPENAVLIAQDLAKRFAALDAAQATTYAANAAAFAKEIEQRLPVWKEELHDVSFIEYHRTWVYAAQRFGMNIAGQVEPLPGIPPTAQHLAALSTTIREKHVPVVIRDLYHPEGPLEFLQRETGARAAVVPASCDEPTPQSYFQLFDRLVSTLNGKS
jgi:zinc/manganese transport system substrate-binding protein